MANMTLRLGDDEEKLLDELMAKLGENTKNKTIIRMIKTYKYKLEQLSEFIERTRAAERELDLLKRAVKDKFEFERKLKELVSD